MEQRESLIKKIKGQLYFFVAGYFKIFAQIKLARWKPKVIVITGSSGKTTTLNLVESQLKDNAVYSHHANSSYGVPFNILGLERKTLKHMEWFSLILLAPFRIFTGTPKQKIYVVEADCDRPQEGIFLSTLLNPEVTIWLSSTRTHSINFDSLVTDKKFPNVESAIAFEYSHFLEKTSNLVIYNSDSDLIKNQLGRTQAKTTSISEKSLNSYEVSKNGTKFKINKKTYSFKFLLPKASFSSVYASILLNEYLNVPIDESFGDFELPPGRSSIFKGIKTTTIIDSTYNTGFHAAAEILNMFRKFPGSKKWVVIGDILEQGKEEREEHEKLAAEILKMDLDRIVLVGPRVIKYTEPVLSRKNAKNVVSFENPKEVLDYLKANIEGGETILFKGARFLEGVIGNLLENKSDISKLARREEVWDERRKKWGL